MKHYDLIVAGGGLTGVAAAVRAAREGLSVLLIEKSGTLGGAMNNNLVYPFMQYFTQLDGETKILCAGLFAEMRERERAYRSELSPDCRKQCSACGAARLLHGRKCDE